MKRAFRLTDTFFIIAAVTTVIVVTVLILRAVYVPITHDEASTFFNYVHTGKLFRPITREEANNHYLNTLLTFASCRIFGSAPLALRLPSVIFSLFYFIFLYKISRFIHKQNLQIIFFVTVSLSLHFIEFFALSRGYGLSMVFLLSAVYFTIKFFRNSGSIFAGYSAISTGLMLFANLSTLIPAIALLMLHLIGRVRSKNVFNKKTFIYFTSEALLIFAAIILLLKLKSSGALYLGTPGGGLFNALKTWLNLLTGSVSEINITIALLTAGGMLTVTAYRLFRNPWQYFISPAFVFDFLLWGSLAGSILAVFLFGVYYPEGRVGLWFFPLFAGSLFFAADSLHDKTTPYLLALPFWIFPVLFILQLNFSYAQAYKNEVIPERFYLKLAEKSNKLPTLGGYHMETTSWAYLNYRHGDRCNLVDWTAFPETLQDYQLFDAKLFPEILKTYDTADYEPLSGLVLLKRKSEPDKKLFQTIRIKTANVEKERLYYPLFGQKSKPEKPLLFEMEFNLNTDASPLSAWIVLQATDNNGKSIIYKYIPTDWLMDYKKHTGYLIRKSLILGNISKPVKEIKLYFWNKDRQQFRLNSGEIKIYEINTR